MSDLQDNSMDVLIFPYISFAIDMDSCCHKVHLLLIETTKYRIEIRQNVNVFKCNKWHQIRITTI